MPSVFNEGFSIIIDIIRFRGPMINDNNPNYKVKTCLYSAKVMKFEFYYKRAFLKL